MDLYEVNAQGALYVESVPSLPVWQSSDESRLIYDENTEILYFADSSRWIGAGAFEAGVIMVFGNSAAPVGWTRKTDWQDNAMFCFSSIGSPTSGGSANPQNSHRHTGPSHTHTMQNHTHSGIYHRHTGTNHVHATTGHQLSVAEMPSHTHTLQIYIESGGHGFQSAVGLSAQTRTTSATGGNQAHSHGDTGSAGAGNTGYNSTGTDTTNGPSNNTTSAAGTGNTSYHSSPHFQELIAAQKD